MSETIYPENLRKYVGVIKQNIDKCYYTYSYQNKEANVYEKKKFPYFDEPSRVHAYQAAVQYKIDYSIQNNRVLNVYTKVVDPEDGSEYYKVQLNVKDAVLLVDIRDLPLVEMFDWRIQNNSKYATCYMNDQEYAKFHTYLTSLKEREHANDHDYDQHIQHMIEILNQKGSTSNDEKKRQRHYISFHLLKYGLEDVDFINKNKLDNRDRNIGFLTKNQRIWKSHIGDAKLRSNNSSGKAGVFYGKCGNYDYWEVRGKDYFGNKIYRKFSINKHGYEGAKHMAVHFRDLIIDKSYKPHQLDEIYKQVVHDFEHYEAQCQKLEISFVNQEATETPREIDPTLLDMIEEDEDFIYSSHSSS